MTADNRSDKDPAPRWQFCLLGAYALPAAPVAHAARKGITQLWQLLDRKDDRTDAFLKTEEKLRMLPEWQLERVAPEPDPHNAAEALNRELSSWLGQETVAQQVVVLIGPPGGGHQEILTAWAEQHAYPMLTPPSAEQILGGERRWVSDQRETAVSNNNQPWVYPCLEKTFLRHTSGLHLVRHFLDQAYSGELGRGVIGCDSWAWAYLRHVWDSQRPLTLALQAFDQRRLQQLFQEQAGAGSRQPLSFRQSNNGHYVLSPPDSAPAQAERSDFLQLLAAHSRGILGVAWSIWRAGLRKEPDDEINAETAAEDRRLPQETIWVTAFDRITLPTVPANASRDAAFVLHALLLHNGLPAALLPQLLPLSTDQSMERLFRLVEDRLVAQQEGIWRVTPQAYPAVRQFLAANGYLVDMF